MSAAHRRLACVTLAALGGCAQNAVLELQLMLPASTDAIPYFALVQVRRGADNPFEVDWAGSDIDAVALANQPQRVQVSVVSSAPDTDVHLKIRFCRAPGCDAIDDASAPELWFALEHPFYLGRRTAWAACIEQVPPPGPPERPVRVDRCQIRGCIAGGSAATYCTASGAHFCETGSVDAAPRDLRCVGGIADY